VSGSPTPWTVTGKSLLARLTAEQCTGVLAFVAAAPRLQETRMPETVCWAHPCTDRFLTLT
jgi:hypothetical protein